MNIKKFLLLFCVSAVVVACGGNKKATSSTRKKESVSSRKRIHREETKITVKEPNPLANVSYKQKIQNYIYEYAEIAKSEMATYGIPASITLAQGILESGAGYGKLTSKAKNHFGIKCHDWTGEKVYHDDDRSQECFRKYDKASESFRDHSLFLKNRKRYAKLFTYKPNDYKSWARGLRAAGYATDRKYPDKLISIIERYQLYMFDAEVLGGGQVAEQTPKTPAKTDDQYVVKKGDTLYSISKRYNMKVDDLKAYNDLKNNAIAIGQILRVKPN